MSNKKEKEDSADAPEAEAKPAPGSKKRPVKVIQVEDISVPIFAYEHERDGERWVNYSWTVSRAYKDSTGAVKRTPWFGQDDCGKVVSAIQQAAEWIHAQKNAGPQDQA
jgi:hypothetical protein